jgi:3-hydroxyisobutyrate dehydrogenase-like beta-hydroxyacid dehydrogenase
MLDGPVSGSVPKARAGTLAIMVGGADADFTRAEPVLRAMGETIIRTGAVGSARHDDGSTSKHLRVSCHGSTSDSVSGYLRRTT